MSELSADEEPDETADQAEEEITADDINGMKRKPLLKLIEDNEIDVDPDDFDDTDDLKAAVLDSLGLSEKKNKKTSKKK